MAWDRLRAEIPAKIAVLLGLSVGICVPYFSLQHVGVFPLRALPETALDRLIPFDPAWLPVYLSIALLVPIPPLLARRREDLRRYARGLAILCVPCFLIFFFFPTEGPRPDALPRDGAYRELVRVDRATNAMPSLHAGLAVYSLLAGFRILRRDLGTRGRVAYGLAAVTWASLIFYATLATRQHQLVDLPPGAFLGWLGHRLAGRAL